MLLIRKEDGLFKCDIDAHTTLVNKDLWVLEDQLDLLENINRIKKQSKVLMMRPNPYIYRLLPINEANKVVAWAEANSVEYDVWDRDPEFDEPDYVDIGLKDWRVYDNADRM